MSVYSSKSQFELDLGWLPLAEAQERKDNDTHRAGYQETRPAGAVASGDSVSSACGPRGGQSYADMEDRSPSPKKGIASR